MKRNKRIGMDVKSLAVKVLEHYNLPPDARLKGVEYNAKNGRMIFEFEHQTFDLVKTVPLVEDKGPKGSGMAGKLKASKKEENGTG